MTENINVNGNVEKLLDRLISVIGDEAVLFETFLEMLEQQQEALVANDAASLRAVTIQLQEVVTQSQQLESRRIDIIDQIRRAAGADDDLNVSQICDMADAARSSQLQAFRTTILELYGRIEETRMRNGLLIEQSLEQIQHTVDIIGRVPAQKETYHKHGGYSREGHNLGLDRRV
jgi:flagellar biosynthesis/type III secretory pathway chaperone